MWKTETISELFIETFARRVCSMLTRETSSGHMFLSNLKFAVVLDEYQQHNISDLCLWISCTKCYSSGFFCRLRSIAAHRDNFARCLSVCLKLMLTIWICLYILLFKNAILTLHLCLKMQLQFCNPCKRRYRWGHRPLTHSSNLDLSDQSSVFYLQNTT